MAQINSIKEFYSDQIVADGAARDIHFHMRVEMDDGTETWLYYGTPVPDPPPAIGAIQYPAVHFPLAFYEIEGASGLLYDLGVEVARAVSTT